STLVPYTGFLVQPVEDADRYVVRRGDVRGPLGRLGQRGGDPAYVLLGAHGRLLPSSRCPRPLPRKPGRSVGTGAGEAGGGAFRGPGFLLPAAVRGPGRGACRPRRGGGPGAGAAG